LGFDSATDSHVELSQVPDSGLRTWGIQVKLTNVTVKEFDCLLNTAHNWETERGLLLQSTLSNSVPETEVPFGIESLFLATAVEP
jgi:hypothetical protein